MAILIDGKKTARGVRIALKGRVEALVSEGVTPGLALVRIGEDPASESYVRSKDRMCRRVGIHSEVHHHPAEFGEQNLEALIAELNRRPDVHGILLQLPLPDGYRERWLLELIDPRKDVDGFHPENVGRVSADIGGFVPCTPLGIQRLLTEHEIEIAGKHVVVVGRSNLVGRPLATILSRKGEGGDATVTLCHSRSRDLPAFTRQADILVAAIGRHHFITPDMVGEGSVVIDVGIHRVERDGASFIEGDVMFDEVEPIARAITPVPGGVGPMTVAMLLENTVVSAERVARGEG